MEEICDTEGILCLLARPEEDVNMIDPLRCMRGISYLEDAEPHRLDRVTIALLSITLENDAKNADGCRGRRGKIVHACRNRRHMGARMTPYG